MTEQAIALAGAVALGLVAGVFYDILRITRVRLKSWIVSGILDLAFWLAAVAALFIYSLAMGNGQLRIFMILGVMGGGTLYFLLLSRPMLWMGYRIADFVRLVFHILTRPIVWVWEFCKKIQKIIKNIFHSGARWFKMKVFKKRADKQGRKKHRGKGGDAHETEIETSGFSNQDYRAHIAGLHGGFSADLAGTDHGSASPGGGVVKSGGGARAKKRKSRKRHRPQRRP